MKNIIFDLDGTLWDSRTSILNAWNNVMKSFNLPNITLEQLTPLTGLQQRDILRSILSVSDDVLIQIEKDITIEEIQYIRKYGGILYTEVEETIKLLANEYNLYIVSNCQDGYIEAFLDYYNLEKYFSDFESAGRTKENKSKNIELIINRNSINDAVYVGDTNGDYEAASANKLPFIFALYGFGNVSFVDFSIAAIYELPKLLKQL